MPLWRLPTREDDIQPQMLRIMKDRAGGLGCVLQYLTTKAALLGLGQNHLSTGRTSAPLTFCQWRKESNDDNANYS